MSLRPSPQLRVFLRNQLPHHVRPRTYSTALPNARFNKPMNYENHPLFHKDASSLRSSKEPFPHDGKFEKLNLCTAIRKTLGHALRTDEDVLVFGEDISFGGVFRCTAGLHEEFGDDRVFNTPLTEQGIAGFGIGCAVQGMRPVAELQFADYVFPAFDQIVNEAAKWRYREGSNGSHAGGLTIRMPCAAVGHGALYHSQSPEALFTHIPGLRVVMPRSPSQAKGLLLASIRCNDPVIFMEPKVLYRGAQEVVPEDEYELPLSKAEVIKEGSDLTIISYGPPLYTSYNALIEAEKDLGISVELIDLRTIYPWDRETVLESIKKTGRAMIVHESMVNAGVGAELAATIQAEAFLHLQAPVKRVAGWSIHTGLVFEPFIIPDVTRVYDAIKQTMEY